jgi:hypothetical protein
MRSSLLLSAAFHVVLFAGLLLASPRRVELIPEQVEVELVSDKDAPKPPEKPEEPQPEKPSVWDFPEQKPKFDLPRLDVASYDKSSTAAPAQTEAASKSKPKPKQQQQQADATVSQQPAPSGQQAAASGQPASASGQQAAASGQQGSSGGQQGSSGGQQSASNGQPAAPTPPQASGFANEPKPEPSIFDPSNIPRLMELPAAQSSGFDAESMTQANLSGDERAAFKAHLRKCWKAPNGLAPATRVVLRISLRPNGALATEPMLIEASASRDGPAVLEAAKRALKECQPFAFLPAEKYREWKVLDLSFTPRDMAGG